VLSASPAPLRQLFDAAIATGADPRKAANWITGEVTAWLRRTETDPADLPLAAEHLAELVAIVDEGVVSVSAAKEVLEGVLAGEGSPREVAEARDLVQISDASALEEAVEEVIAANPDAAASLRAGETKVLGFLVGQVMRATGGKADPRAVNASLRAKLSS